MKAVFTVASPNFLGYAISLYNSVIKHNQDVSFYIGLFRPQETVDFTELPNGINILFIDDIGGDEHIEKFIKRYPINKICMAFKPYVASKIFEREPSIEKLIFFDSDILVFNKLDNIWNDLDNNNIVLTPHLLKPLPTDEEHMELRMMCRAGVYNTGFFALKRSNEASNFLDWWFSKMSRYGIIGDQIWMNFAPTFFNIKTSRHLGNNVAFYNLPNREITFNDRDNTYLINGKDELIFFHYIKHNPFSDPPVVSSARLMQKQINFNDKPELKPIFKAYKDALIEANFKSFKKLTFKGQQQSYFTKKFVNYKHQLIRLLFKVIFDTTKM